MSDTSFETHFENHEKKFVGSKNVFHKSCRKFHILGGDFFHFDKIQKMRVLEPKKDFLEWSKKTQGKKMAPNKRKAIIKVVQKFSTFFILLKSKKCGF